jgi:RNA polymerase subunit RPABC4/transcription elongation factor Spt4
MKDWRNQELECSDCGKVQAWDTCPSCQVKKLYNKK